MSLTSSIRGLLRGRIHSTRSVLKCRTNFDCRTFAIHSSVRLIFLAASILAQLAQKPFPEGNSMEKTGPPHFLHLAGTVISTYFMIISCVASIKEKTKRLVFANQSSQNGLIFSGLQKTVHLRQQKSCWLFLGV